VSRVGWTPVLATGLLVLAACGSTASGSQPTTPNPSPGSSGASSSMMPGMSMAPGESMSNMARTGDSKSMSGTPSADSRLVCGPEIRRDIGHLLPTQPAPRGSATWLNDVYTCTYRLPAGPLVLEVTESATVQDARRDFVKVRRALKPTQRLKGLTGLGLPSFETRTGTTVFLKDNKVLRVDATALKRSRAGKSASRTEVAYEVATDVMGCWAEN
jgi:hypothetical protein